MSTAQAPMYEWNDLPWKSIERAVFKLQQRIYRASSRGDRKAVHRLQRLLTRSQSARLLAVRRVTQDNRGKKTAGVDGVKALAPPGRLALSQTLRLSAKARPVRRVRIPKPGKEEKRPLGIPTLENRAQQALAKLALEPEWEARFEPNSYGFRPGRSCHDAIEAIFTSINKKAKYALDADIAQCFDRICHTALLDKLGTFPAMRRAIKAWLAAGVMDGGDLFPTTEGSPQGGVASPLLANVALHGLETAIVAAFAPKEGKPTVVRYADDFVVLHPDLSVIERARQVATDWLAPMGLQLKPSKTRIAHTLHHHDGKVGFDFLGFAIRQHPAGKHRAARVGNQWGAGHSLGFKTIITPSKEAVARHAEALGTVIARHRAAPQAALIDHLNPIIRGWTRYYSTVSAKRTFSTLSYVMYPKLRRWAKRRHPRKGGPWISSRYWHPERGTWLFATKDGVKLFAHHKMPIRRHVKVRGSKSPYDGDWAYWAQRLGEHPQLPRRVATLLRWQRGKCARCGLYFRDGDLLEVDHVIPLSAGGRDGYSNWQLVHRHCHDQKTAGDGSLRPRGAHAKSQSAEEPDEGITLMSGSGGGREEATPLA
jgi:RNA-directed DNA polymerase